jgi:hypothetical protein
MPNNTVMEEDGGGGRKVNNKRYRVYISVVPGL